MDTDRFDALVRGLATAAPRRRALRGVAAGVLGMLGGALGSDQGTAKKRKKKCRGQKKRCGTKCVPSRACCMEPRRGQWLPEGGEHGQCGICINGKVVKDPVACLLVDPDGCTDCDGDTFECVPAADGTRCVGCGTCDGGLCGEPDEERQCGDSCCSGATPVCVDPGAGQCCVEERACPGECCQADSGLGLEDGEVCTRDGCCPQVKAATNCRADHDDQEPCTEKICCDDVWTQAGRGLACPPGAGVPPETRAYCCGPGKSCCFTGCCPSGSRCCGGEMNCCPDAAQCGSASCFAPTPDHV